MAVKTHNFVVDTALAASSIAALGIIKDLQDVFALLGSIVMFGVAVARLLLLLYELRERKRNAQGSQKSSAEARGDSQAD
jgi:hypothetical protein